MAPPRFAPENRSNSTVSTPSQYNWVNSVTGEYWTVADGLLPSGAGSFPPVHTAPVVPQARPPGRVIVTASRDSCSTSTAMSQRSLRPSIRRATVTLPPVTVKDSSRKVSSPIAMSSLKATRKRMAPSPSCAGGILRNSAVSGSRTPLATSDWSDLPFSLEGVSCWIQDPRNTDRAPKPTVAARPHPPGPEDDEHIS